MKMKQLFKNEENWCQGRYEGPRNSFCLIGAARYCYGQNTIRFEKIIEKMKKYIRHYSRKHSTIADYNDDKNRIFGDIKRLVINLDI